MGQFAYILGQPNTYLAAAVRTDEARRLLYVRPRRGGDRAVLPADRVRQPRSQPAAGAGEAADDLLPRHRPTPGWCWRVVGGAAWLVVPRRWVPRGTT